KRESKQVEQPVTMAAPAQQEPKPQQEANPQQEPNANEGAKTAEELAAEAAASPDAMPPDIGDMAAPAKEAAGNNAAAQSNPPDDIPAASEKTKMSPEEEAEAKRREDRLYADLGAQGMIDLPPDERYKKVMAMSTEEKPSVGE